MRKKKQLPSRKRRTARYLLALAAVVLVSSLTGFYTFLPGRAAIESADREEGIENAHVVGRLWAPDLAPEQGRLLYLVEGERAMMLCPVHFDLFGGGWNGGLWCVAETWDGEGLYGGVLQNQDTNVSYVFGRVDDPRIQNVSVNQNYEEPGQFKTNALVIAESAYFEKDGKRYFIQKFPYDTNWEKWPEYRLVSSRGAEQIVDREIRCASWS